MTTSEARKNLPGLVRAGSQIAAPSDSLLGNAVQIQTRGERQSVYLIPEVDAMAAEARIEELEEELEDISLLVYVQDRVANSTGERLSASEFLTGIGMAEYVEQLPDA